MIAFFRVLWGAASDFRRHGCTSLAASLAFFSLLSFFPLIFLLLYGISFVVSQERIGFDFLLNFLEGFLPTLGVQLAEEIRRLASEQVMQWVVFFTFVWFGLLVFYELDYTVNVVFEVPLHRHPLISMAVSIVLLALVGLLLLLSYVVTQVLGLMVQHAPRIAGIDVVAVTAHGLLLSYLLPFILVLMAVTCLYRYLPHRTPPWRHAIVGGLVLAVLWEFAKHVFSSYVQDLTVYSRMYGSLIVVVLFLLWVYYSAALFLFGAAIVHRLQARTPSK
ncbi:MAG: YihY/virulence factor BrkB family protein [Nitrospiraceae bacterium]